MSMFKFYLIYNENEISTPDNRPNSTDSVIFAMEKCIDRIITERIHFLPIRMVFSDAKKIEKFRISESFHKNKKFAQINEVCISEYHRFMHLV